MERRRGLLEVAREKMRTRHMACRTEQAYLRWIRQYVVFHQRRHPRELGAEDVERFLSYLAVERKVSAATRNQTLQGLLFLYRQVPGVELPWHYLPAGAGSMAMHTPSVRARRRAHRVIRAMFKCPPAQSAHAACALVPHRSGPLLAGAANLARSQRLRFALLAFGFATGAPSSPWSCSTPASW